jgi:hypothetical protein
MAVEYRCGQEMLPEERAQGAHGDLYRISLAQFLRRVPLQFAEFE